VILIIVVRKDGIFILAKINHFFHAIIPGKIIRVQMPIMLFSRLMRAMAMAATATHSAFARKDKIHNEPDQNQG
jgi:hypothetical protein